MKFVAFIAVLFTAILLWSAVEDFPVWGDAQSPANRSPVSLHYITESGNETAVPNLVTAVLADYRSFDTLFETVVILTAGIAIMAILGGLPLSQKEKAEIVPEDGPTDRDLIVIHTCRLIIPVMQLFGLYVIAHGHHSPGGGFQGGVILGASLILWAIARDLPAALERVPAKRIVVLAGAGVLIYAGIGALCLLLGGNFLDYSRLHPIIPGADQIMARSHSMLGVEIGVAFTVSATMFGIYAFLSSKGRLKGGL